MKIIEKFSFLVFVLCMISCGEIREKVSPIDRQALVQRHIVHITEADSLNSLSVGNGEFAFTVDVTGLQSFPEFYENGVSLGTQSQWAWHAFPNKENYRWEEILQYDTSATGQVISHPVQNASGRKKAVTDYFRQNPHRLHLGLVGMELTKSNGEKAVITELGEIDQKLDPWTGEIRSLFSLEGIPVEVIVYGHQEQDGMAARIKSQLLSEGRLKVSFKFPYGSGCHTCPGYDWESPDLHQSRLEKITDEKVRIHRHLDTTAYVTEIQWRRKNQIMEVEKHHFELVSGKADQLEFSVFFSKEKLPMVPDFLSTAQNSIAYWNFFWESGGVIDFSGSTDPRAHELERRVVLSQYLTRISTAGSLPPQETGLTMNSWYGKFHIEMHWWHGTHFLLWNRPELLTKSLDWYSGVFEKAKNTAQRQGFEGARWQKMTDPYGDESPSSIAAYLIWQQPHILYFLEELYRINPEQAHLEKYREIVKETVDFMASFAQKNEQTGKYHLIAPLIPAQELFPFDNTDDPPFELVYWHYGLGLGIKWMERLGESPDPRWQEVYENLSPLAVKDGLYLPSSTHPEAYENEFYLHDHPVVLGALGVLPQTGMVDPEIMIQTLNKILEIWKWDTTWGWDYPMIAMNAARLGRPHEAIDALFMDVQKNTYLKNGHNYQDERLRIYLPGNGGLLTAVAMMAAGWEGGPGLPNPGFPQDGSWVLRWKGLRKMQ